MNTKTLYIIKHIAFVTLFAMGFLLVPAFNSTGTVSAQKGLNKEVASSDALYQALNLGQATDLAVYADKGVSDKASSSVNGKVLSQTDAPGAKGELARKDLSVAFSKINQLPCTELSDSNLSGKTFGPGVYCLSSAELEGQLTLDGANSNSAIFVFRIAGSLNTKSGSNISLTNGAQSSNVFFSAQDSATIGESTNFKGNILARNSIAAESGAVIEGRALSLKGDVELNNSILAPAAPGVIEICKAIDATGGAGLENRIFNYQIGAQVISVAAGECSPQISIEAGAVTITELNSGTFTNAPGTWTGNFQLIGVNQLDNVGAPAGTTTTLVSANLPQRTALVNVVAGTSAAQTRIQFVNRFAIIGAIEICKEAIDSGVSGIFNFTIDGLRNGDTTGLTPGPVVGGTVGASGTLPGTPAPLVTFPVFAGQCSGSIFVPVPADAAGSPRVGTATVNELPRFGYIFTSATTLPGNPSFPANTLNRLVGFNALANGGGNATVLVVAGTTGPGGGNDTTGAVNTQTTVFFNNRTVPGTVKVCKVAGPGIAVNTPFTFNVTGVVANAPVAAPTTVPVATNGPGTSTTTINVPGTTSGGLPVTQNPSQGTAQTGATLQGGTVQSFQVVVLAGAEPTGVPFSGGNCVDVRTAASVNGSTAPTVPFVVDTAVLIIEVAPATTTIVNADGTSTGVTGQVRVSRITSNTGIITTGNNATNPALANSIATSFPIVNPLPSTATAQPNVSFYPMQTGATTGGITNSALVPVRAGTTEVEFVNIAFYPVPLKICKVAGTGITPNVAGTAVTFTVTPDNANGLLNGAATTVAVIPGASTTESPFGNCDFVGGGFNGPFGAGAASFASLNTFNFNTAVTVQETGGVSNTVVTPVGNATYPNGGIFTPPGSPAVIANIANRSGVISSLGIGTNEIVFVNQAATAATIKSRKRVRFF